MTTTTYHVNLSQLINNAISVLQFEKFSQQGWIKEDKVPVLDNQCYVSLLQECNETEFRIITQKISFETNSGP